MAFIRIKMYVSVREKFPFFFFHIRTYSIWLKLYTIFVSIRRMTMMTWFRLLSIVFTIFTCILYCTICRKIKCYNVRMRMHTSFVEHAMMMTFPNDFLWAMNWNDFRFFSFLGLIYRSKRRMNGCIMWLKPLPNFDIDLLSLLL